MMKEKSKSDVLRAKTKTEKDIVIETLENCVEAQKASIQGLEEEVKKKDLEVKKLKEDLEQAKQGNIALGLVLEAEQKMRKETQKILDENEYAKIKSAISCASFDGWIENSGENCDGFEEHVQLLKEDDALEVINKLFNRVREIVNQPTKEKEEEPDYKNQIKKRAQQTSGLRQYI
jgi:hypothetical protein